MRLIKKEIETKYLLELTEDELKRYKDFVYEKVRAGDNNLTGLYNALNEILSPETPVQS